MGPFKRWKAKHWDVAEPVQEISSHATIMRLHGKAPPLRRACRRVAKLSRERPLEFWALAVGAASLVVGSASLAVAMLQR